MIICPRAGRQLRIATPANSSDLRLWWPIRGRVAKRPKPKLNCSRPARSSGRCAGDLSRCTPIGGTAWALKRKKKSQRSVQAVSGEPQTDGDGSAWRRFLACGRRSRLRSDAGNSRRRASRGLDQSENRCTCQKEILPFAFPANFTYKSGN